MANPWDNDPIVAPAPAAASAMPWDSDPIVKPAASAAQPSTWDRVKSTAVDVAQSAVSGVNKGVLGIAGLPGDFATGLGTLADKAAEKITGQPVQRIGSGRPLGEVLGSENLRKQYEGVTSPLYQPQTTAGKFASTVGEFLPASGGGVGNAVRFAVIPGIASEAVGQATEGSGFEGAARAATAIGAGGIAALASRPDTAQAAIAGSMRGIDDATVNIAGQLMQQAQARGIALTWPEAVAQASGGGGKGLTNLQRVVEGSQGGGDTMGAFMAQRPAQIDAAGRQAVGTIAPPSAAPSTIGPAIGQAAEQTAADARALRTQAVRPAYEAAANDVVPAERVNAVIAQLDQIIANDATGQLSAPAQQMRAQLIERQGVPGIPATRTPVTDPRSGRVIRYEATPAVEATPPVPRTNVGQLDEVYGSARDQFTGPAPLGQTGTEARANRLAGQAVTALDTELQAASPALSQGRQQYQAITRQFIEPLLQGPIGKLADRDITTRKAIEVLFPTNPLPGSAPEIINAIGNLAQRNPTAARQIVRAHIESVFNEATQQLQTGANQFGGAGFAAVLRGNTQQAENLAAAIQGVAGPQVLQGFDEFLNVLSATGQRQRIGSQTAFNQEAQDVLRRGGAIGEAANAVATAGIKLPGRVKDAYEQWRLGQNTQQIAQLFTDPNALAMFRRLAAAAPGSNQAQAVAARLAVMATQTRNQ